MNTSNEANIIVNHILPTFGPAAGGVGTVVKNISNSKYFQNNLYFKIIDLGNKEKFIDGEKILTSISGSLPLSLIKVVKALSSNEVNVLHLHGIWHPLSASCSLTKRISTKGFICSPHGMLTNWILSQKKYKKKIAWLMWEAMTWSSVDCFHALTEAEAEEIAAIVPKNKKIAIIKNGIDVSEENPLTNKTIDQGQKYILYLGRFHQKKGIEELILAWTQLGSKVNSIKLKLVGWGDMDCLVRLLPPTIEILPPVFDELEKNNLIKNSEFLILPSYSEGLPMVVLEAWAQGTPVIMTPECNLKMGFFHNAAISIDPNIESIKQGLIRAISLSEGQKNEMGLNGWKLCLEKYSIKEMSRKLNSLYTLYSDSSKTKQANTTLDFFQ